MCKSRGKGEEYESQGGEARGGMIAREHEVEYEELGYVIQKCEVGRRYCEMIKREERGTRNRKVKDTKEKEEKEEEGRNVNTSQ